MRQNRSLVSLWRISATWNWMFLIRLCLWVKNLNKIWPLHEFSTYLDRYSFPLWNSNGHNAVLWHGNDWWDWIDLQYAGNDVRKFLNKFNGFFKIEYLVQVINFESWILLSENATLLMNRRKFCQFTASTRVTCSVRLKRLSGCVDVDLTSEIYL